MLTVGAGGPVPPGDNGHPDRAEHSTRNWRGCHYGLDHACVASVRGTTSVWRGETSFWAFLVGFWTSWAALMTSIPSLPLAIATYFVEQNTAKVCLWVTAVVCLIISSYLVWRAERIKLLELTKKQRDLEERDLILRKREIETREEQTDELRRNREQRDPELDPAIRAFRETRYRSQISGHAADDQTLDEAVSWIAAKSAWGRLQAAESGVDNMFHIGLLIAAGDRLLKSLESGTIIVCARREGSFSYEELAPSFWRDRKLNVNSAPARYCAVSIGFRDNHTNTDSDKYVDPCCDLNLVKELFPEQDELLDAATAEILAKRSHSKP